MFPDVVIPPISLNEHPPIVGAFVLGIKVEGARLGDELGDPVGLELGVDDGSIVGWLLGVDDGGLVGASDGKLLGPMLRLG